MSHIGYRNPLDDIININGVPVKPEYISVKSILRRFTKAQLLKDVIQCSRLPRLFPPDSHSRRIDKDQIINHIIQIAEDLTDLATFRNQVELKYYQTHQNARIWRSVVIKNPKVFIEKETDADKFANKLQKYLRKSRFFCSVYCEFYEEALWTMIVFNRKQLKPHVSLVLTFPKMPFFLYSNLLKTQEEQVFRALTELFRGRSSEKSTLQSKNLKAILQCMCKQLKLDDIVQEQPLSVKINDAEVTDLPANVYYHGEKEEAEKNAYITQTFGSYEQPRIEVLTYQIESDYIGSDARNDEDDEDAPPIISRVIFKGENVLEGMRELTEAEAADYPLPDHITKVGTEFGNNISLRLKHL